MRTNALAGGGGGLGRHILTVCPSRDVGGGGGKLAPILIIENHYQFRRN